MVDSEFLETDKYSPFEVLRCQLLGNRRLKKIQIWHGYRVLVENLIKGWNREEITELESDNHDESYWRCDQILTKVENKVTRTLHFCCTALRS
ncbi:hypothetical protein L596_000631 [Steinernema carpocapsae]|uniref:Uncharacterized protein n=1 Tax=Steinernema carpocapsae TaxID=34508 RepID=A0A4U8UIM7_STECR|nr:hypothetical protein L596_000631 [Steinernema carpocapsae]